MVLQLSVKAYKFSMLRTKTQKLVASKHHPKGTMLVKIPLIMLKAFNFGDFSLTYIEFLHLINTKFFCTEV